MDNSKRIVEVDCPLCGSKESKKLFTTYDYLFRVSNHPFAVQRCHDCGAGYLSPRPAFSDMGDYYPEAFYWSWEGSEVKLDWSSIIKKREQQLKAKAEWLQGIKPGELLDIGAQKGEFIWFMQKQGWTVEGVEMDSKVPNPASLPIRYGDFLEMEFAEKKYDVITFWAVLEHVYEPARFIEKASRMLKPNGRLIVLVTNMNSIQCRYYRADDYPRHLTLFTNSSVKQLCKANGLDLSRISTDQKIFGGSLSGGGLYLVKRIFGYSTDEAMTEWKQLSDPELFWCKWKGRPSKLVRLISKLDRLVTLPLEYVLDRLGYGYILTFSADKNSFNEK